MPRARVQKQLVPVPLTSGLSQREDAAHVQPGQALQITNYIKGKQSTLEKAPGYQALTASLPLSNKANISYVAALATHKSTPLVVATDPNFGPALYSYSNAANGLSLIDRVSEVFLPTPQTVVAYQQSISELDVAIISPSGTPKYVLHVWGLDATSTSTYRIYYTLKDYVTGAVVIPAQEVASLVSTSGSFVAPKLVTCMSGGTTNLVILTVGLSGTHTLYGTAFSPTTLTWGSITSLVTDIFNPAVYDASGTEDDLNHWVLIYEKSGSRTIGVDEFNTSLALTHSGTFSDTTWSGMAGNPHITGFAVRASLASSGAWLALAWSNGAAPSVTAYVHGGGLAYPALSSTICSAVDLTNGLTSAYPGPQLLDIKEVVLANNIQQVVWSPPNTKVGYDPTYVATPSSIHPPPLTAIYQSAFYPNATTGTLMAQQPRWTNGVTLASRMWPYQLAQGLGNTNSNTDAGQALVVGFMPSNNLNPTWSGLASIATPNTANVNSVAYPPYVTVGGLFPYGGPNGRAYGAVAGGGQGQALLGLYNAPTTYKTTTAWGSPPGGNVTNVAVTEPGSGYTSPPTATLGWGVGSTLVPLFANVLVGGVLTGIRGIDTANHTGQANQTVSGSNVTLNLNMTFGVTPTIAGATVTLSGAMNANNNGTFAILSSSNIGTSGLEFNIRINNPLGVPENNMSCVINDNNGAGFDYDMQPNTVPVYVQDVPNNLVYTTLVEAVVGTGSNAGALTAFNLTGAANVNVLPGGSISDIFNSNVHVWIPQPNTPAPQFGGTTNTATSLGCFSNVPTTLVQSSGYENVQGSFFLFSMDTFSDFTSPNDVGTPYRNAPMRLIASLKPRLGLNSIMSGAHTLPHIAQTWPIGVPASGWGPPVFDLPINISPTSVGITQFEPEVFPSWVLQAPMYLGDELGGLTAISAGLPTLTDGLRISEFSYPYFPENLYASGASAPPGNGGYLYPGSSYQYIAAYERMDTVGNTHRSGRSVPVEVVTVPTYDDSRYSTSVVVPTMGFSPSNHGTNSTNLANVPAQPQSLIQLYRTSSPGSTSGGLLTTGGTEFFNLSATSLGQANNDLWSPYVVINDGLVNTSADSAISTHPLLYGDGSNGTDPGSNLDSLTPPALQGLIVHKNRFWGFEGSNVWYTKSFTSGEGPGFNEEFAFSVDDGSGDITALASMDERLLIFKRDRIFYVVGDGPNDNLSSNDLQPPQRIQSDVGAVSQASIIVAPSGVWFLSDDGLYQVTRKFDVAHYGAFVDDTLATYSVLVSGRLDQVNGRLIWLASKPKTSGLTPGAVLIIYSYLWDAWTIQQLDEGGGTYGIAQPAGLVMASTPPALTLGGNFSNTGGPFLMQEAPNTYLTPNSAGTNTYQQAIWQSPWIKAQDFQGFARWMLMTLSWYNSDTNQLQVQLDYNYSNGSTQTQTVSAAAMLTAQKSGSPYPIVQWEFQPNNPKAESFRITITDMKDSVSNPVSGKGSILLACTVTMALKDGTKTYPVPVSQRGTA